MTKEENNDGKETKDLDTLRREYRNMEVNRKMFAEESSTILRRQLQTLDNLREENESLKTDVATVQARTTLKPLNSFEQSQLDKISLEIERYNNLIDVEKTKNSSMERQIATHREKIWIQRRKMGGANAASENQRNVEKQVRMLENKLDQAVVKFNKSLANNRNLRQDIDNLRGERVAFEGVYKKLEKGLKERKKQMAEVIEHSNTAHEQRDKARMEIVSIEKANKKEQEQFDKQMDDMGKALEEEISTAAERRKKQQQSIGNIEEESKIAAEKAAKANTLVREREALAEERKNKISYYEDAIQKIEGATGIRDVDKLIQIFQENEENNFSLFTFANAQADEIDGLEEIVQKLREEKKESISEASEDSILYEQELKEIEVKIKIAVRQATKFEVEANRSHDVLDSLKDGIKMLLTRLDFTEESIGEVRINDANMLQFMGIIEDRANEVLKEYYRYDPNSTVADDTGGSVKALARVHNVLGPGPLSPKAKDNVSVHPPKIHDYSSDEEYSADEGDVSRPLSLDELKTKTMSRMNRPRKKSAVASNIPVATNGRRRGSLVMTRKRGSFLLPQHAIKPNVLQKEVTT